MDSDFDWPPDHSVPLFTLTKRGSFVAGAVAGVLFFALLAILQHYSSNVDSTTGKPVHVVADCNNLISNTPEPIP